ncbi:MAG: hypothetical protein ACTHOU_21540 [Aureliella sp.]
MSTNAEVRSLAQLQNLRERCGLTRAQALKEAEILQSELHKLSRWLTDEAARYWDHERAQAERWLKECQAALTRCQATVRADEQRPCTDERKRLELAVQRRTLCEAKARAVREAQLVWQQQLAKLRGRLQATVDMAESDLAVTLQQLSTLIATLETYAQIRTTPPPE